MSEERWFFLRGLGRDSRHWGDFIEAFKSQRPTCRTSVLMDLPGAGTNTGENSPQSIAAMTDFLRSRYFVNISEKKTYLLAVSLGGMVAFDWAARYPRDFSGIIVINTSSAGISPLHHRLQPRALLSLVKAVLSPSKDWREQLILSLVSNRRPLDQNTLASWQAAAQRGGISLPNLLRQLAAARRFKFPEFSVRPPILLLASQRDRLADYRCSERLAQKYGLPLALHPTAGHDLALDDANWISKQTALWLEPHNLPKPQ